MMTEKQLKKWTRPIKFRAARLWCRSIVSAIKYQVCNILNKINILDRYNCRDNGERPVSIDFPVEPLEVSSTLIRGVLVPTVVQTFRIHEDYFYRRTKKGDKRVLVLEDTHDTQYIMSVCIKNLKLCLGGKYYECDQLPVVKFTLENPTKLMVERARFRTFTYDLTPVKRLTCSAVMADPYDPDEFMDAYKHLYEQFSHYIKGLSLADLGGEVL